MNVQMTKIEIEKALSKLYDSEVSLEILEDKIEQKSSSKKYEFTGLYIEYRKARLEGYPE